MPIMINCTCGKALRAPDAFAGKRVKCPACGSQVTVPDAAPAKAAAAAPRPARTPTAPANAAPELVRFSCECGKAMQAKAEYGGRLARCPACGENVLIPSANGSPDTRLRADRPTPVPKKTPAPPPPEEDEEDIPELEEVAEREDDFEEERPSKRRAAARNGDADFEGEEEDERPRKRGSRSVKVQKKSGALLWISLSVAAVLLLGGGTALAWIFLKNSSGAVDDLAFVPGNVQGIVSLRLGEAGATPLGKQLVDQLPPAAKAQLNTGMGLAEVDRMTMVFFNVQTNLAADPSEAFWIVLLASQPMSKDAVFKGAGDTFAEQKTNDGKVYYIPSNPNNQSLWFVSDRIVIAGKPAALQRAMHLPPSPASGPLDDAIKEIRSKQHQIVAAFAPSPEMAPRPDAPAAPFMKPFQPLLETTLVKLTADLDQGISSELTLKFASEDKAKAAKTAADQLKALMALMPGAPPGAKSDPTAPLKDALKNLAVEQSGSSISTKVSLDGPAVMAMVQGAAAGLAGRPNPGAAAAKGFPLRPGAAQKGTTAKQAAPSTTSRRTAPTTRKATPPVTAKQ